MRQDRINFNPLTFIRRLPIIPITVMPQSIPAANGKTHFHWSDSNM